MQSINRPGRFGTYMPVVCMIAVATFQVSLANAETVVTVNGTPIDSMLVDAYIENRTKRPAAQATPQQREALTAELTDIFVLSTQESAADALNEPAISMQIELQRRAILAQAVAGFFYEQTEISEEEILAAYENLAPTMQYKARHILVPTQGEAVDIIELLLDDGNFEEIAKEKSTGPSGPNGGDLGWFSADQMVPQFSNAVARLPDGRYTTDPVQTQFGWHVILREGSREAPPPTLESARESIEQTLKDTKFQAYLAEIRTRDVKLD